MVAHGSSLLLVCALLCTLPGDEPERETTPLRQQLEQRLEEYFAARDPDDVLARQISALCAEQHELLVDVLRSKSYVRETVAVTRRGVIDDGFRFRDRVDDTEPNAAFLHVPSTEVGLAPLAVFLPDTTSSSSYERMIIEEGTERGWAVLLVPDLDRKNEWNPVLDEHRRIMRPLRDALLGYRIDPDRVFLVGSGRGGHATWDVGLLHADRFAGLHPCNGGLIHQGGYGLSGGVFLENATDLMIRTVYNTTFDHGIEGCRVAAERFEAWDYDFAAVEEDELRVMDLAEATAPFTDVRRNAHPPHLLKRFNWLETGRHHWLEALDRRPGEWDPAEKIKIRGEWPDDGLGQRQTIWRHVQERCGLLQGSIADNTLTIRVEGVRRVRVFFDLELLDESRPVHVSINGKKGRRVKLTRSVEAMLRQVHRTGDTSRLYWNSKDFDVPR